MKWGVSTIGWMISWLAMGLIPLVEMTTCTQGSTDAWLVSLVFYTPIALFGLVLLYFGRDNSRSTRWLVIPHAVLVPFAVVTAIRYLWRSTILGDHLCTIATREVGFASMQQQWWNPLWAPVQLLLVAGVAVMIWLYWRPAAAGSPANQPLDRTAGTSGAAWMKPLRDARGRSAARR